jgi:hypothetical protein
MKISYVMAVTATAAMAISVLAGGAAAGAADSPDATLVGRAVLPVQTYAEGPRRVAIEDLLPLGDQRGEPAGVDAILIDHKPVTGRLSHQQPGCAHRAECGPYAVHILGQRRCRPFRRRVSPHHVDEPI